MYRHALVLSALVALPSNAEEIIQLTRHPAEDRAPAWSPDGTTLLFASVRDGNRSIYRIDADGSNVERVTSLEHVDHYPAWAPDASLR